MRRNFSGEIQLGEQRGLAQRDGGVLPQRVRLHGVVAHAGRRLDDLVKVCHLEPLDLVQRGADLPQVCVVHGHAVQPRQPGAHTGAGRQLQPAEDEPVRRKYLQVIRKIFTTAQLPVEISIVADITYRLILPIEISIATDITYRLMQLLDSTTDIHTQSADGGAINSGHNNSFVIAIVAVVEEVVSVVVLVLV